MYDQIYSPVTVNPAMLTNNPAMLSKRLTPPPIHGCCYDTLLDILTASGMASRILGDVCEGLAGAER